MTENQKVVLNILGSDDPYKQVGCEITRTKTTKGALVISVSEGNSRQEILNNLAAGLKDFDSTLAPSLSETTVTLNPVQLATLLDAIDDLRFSDEFDDPNDLLDPAHGNLRNLIPEEEHRITPETKETVQKGINARFKREVLEGDESVPEERARQAQEALLKLMQEEYPNKERLLQHETEAFMTRQALDKNAMGSVALEIAQASPEDLNIQKNLETLKQECFLTLHRAKLAYHGASTGSATGFAKTKWDSAEKTLMRLKVTNNEVEVFSQDLNIPPPTPPPHVGQGLLAGIKSAIQKIMPPPHPIAENIPDPGAVVIRPGPSPIPPKPAFRKEPPPLPPKPGSAPEIPWGNGFLSKQVMEPILNLARERNWSTDHQGEDSVKLVLSNFPDKSATESITVTEDSICASGGAYEELAEITQTLPYPYVVLSSASNNEASLVAAAEEMTDKGVVVSVDDAPGITMAGIFEKMKPASQAAYQELVNSKKEDFPNKVIAAAHIEPPKGELENPLRPE